MTEQTITILLVEDNPADAGLLKATLLGADGGRFKIIPAIRLKDALEKLRNEHFDVLLLDLSLPDSMGLDTISAIQKTSKHIPIIVLTGNDDEELGIEAVRHGVQDYLVKGLIPERVLIQAIDYAIERKRIEEELRTAKEEMEERVRQRTRDLQNTVAALQDEVNERLRTEEALRASQLQLRSLTSELSLAEERERRSIALLLHDHIGQLMAMAKIKLGGLKKIATAKNAVQLIDDVRGLIDEAINSTRSLTLQISPPILYTLGLGAAIATACENFKNDYGIDCKFEDDETSKVLTDDFRATLFRSVNELLLNIAKHAKAKSVRVSFGRKNNHIQIMVRDNGVGFNVSEVTSRPASSVGFGLMSIRERLGHLGGTFTIESAPGKGTTITLTAPLQK
jgi:signal transduction histidine kinase